MNMIKSFISHPKGKEMQSESMQRELNFLSLYMMLPMMVRMTAGHQLEDFIKSCTFGGLECNPDDG